MAGRGLPVFDRWVQVHTVVPGTGHTTDSGVYVEDTPRVVHDRKVGAALRRAPISYDDPLRYASVEVIDLLIRDGTTGRAILNEFGGQPDRRADDAGGSGVSDPGCSGGSGIRAAASAAVDGPVQHHLTGETG